MLKMMRPSAVMTENWFITFKSLPYPLLSTATVTNPLGFTVVLNCSGIGNSTCKKTFNNATSIKLI
jgi:hypothetical protein